MYFFFLFLGLGNCEKRLGRKYMFRCDLKHIYLTNVLVINERKSA